MKNRKNLIPFFLVIFLFSACRPPSEPLPTNTIVPESTPEPTLTSTPLPPKPVEPGLENPDEPVFINGEIPYTSPFFLNTISQPFVLLEDQAGFIERNREFEFPLEGQVIGPVKIHEDEKLTYSLSLPSIPQGTLVDIDNNGQNDVGVQVFAIAYWSNTWGDPFLEQRDGTGWSTAYASTITDPENDDEIMAGTLIVWSPDDEQSFPTSYGEDGLLFTIDDPTAPIPPGYNIVDLSTEPFRFYKEAEPKITLNEGVIAVNDYSEMSYADSFKALFEKASREYPFTEEKQLNWEALYDKFLPNIENANSPNEFYRALKEFNQNIPDGHVNLSFNQDVFFEDHGGGFGLVLTELSDGRVLATEILPGYPANAAGIQTGAEIISWNESPVSEAIEQVIPFFGPFSTEHAKRIGQVNFLTRVLPDTQVDVLYLNPGESQEQKAMLKAQVEYDSLFKMLPYFNQDELVLPVEGHVLDDSGLGYVRILTFSDDYQLMARLWVHYIQSLIDSEVPGLIIDLRANGGGSSDMAMKYAGYFFDEERTLYQNYYYNENSGTFEPTDHPTKIEPAPLYFDGKIAVLVSPDCVSACEGFAYALQTDGRSIIVGHNPSAGAFGEVGRGQYNLPDELSMQFPTGRSETENGELVIEGIGIIPDIIIPVTEESALGQIDALLEAAIQELSGN